MSYAAAITELRQIIADTEFHKKATGKKLLGDVNGENKSFYSYDKRLLEDTVEVMVNNVAASFTLDDSVKGQFTLATAPDKNTAVTANYYYTWWLDDEIKNFLNKGAESTSQWNDNVPDDAYLSILPGLKGAALNLAANLALKSLIMYLVNRRHSEEFNLAEDGNDDTKFSQTIAAMQKMADSFWKDGMTQRDDFYKRQGKRNAPAFGIKLGSVRNYGPRR